MSTRLLAGRYELLERIGSGGMAVVYKARCRLLNRYVAIKILKPEFTKDVKFIENFRRESQAAAGLSHPNIVNVYDVGREGNIHYIVMELIEGEALSDLIAREAPLDYKLVIDITKQIASALSFAHQHQIIHRDVKPHNIMITANGTAKITDFGIAKAVNAATIVGNTGTVMGSVHYFSPEQARGGYVDEKSDIYSLGIVMYEMLTGKVPFDGENPVAVALMHINEDIVPPSKLVNGIPPRLEQIVMKATDKISINRYKTAAEMLDALNNLEFVSSIVGDSALSGAYGAHSAYGGYNSYGAASGETVTYGASYGTAETAGDGAAPGAQTQGGNAEAGAETAAGAAESGEGGSKHGKKKEKKKRKINKITVLAVIAALICAIPISNLIASGIGSLGKTKTVEVPDLTGYTVEEATDMLDELGLELEEGDTVVSEYDEGLIVSQDPEEGTEVKKGKTITVNISKGVKEGTVPKLVGSSFSDAEYILEKYGYKVGNVSYEASSLPEGMVVSQDPEAGVERSSGTYVNIVVSQGGGDDTKATMPSLLGKSLDTAKKEIESAGLAVGEITYGVSSAYGENEVMWQQYDAGKTLEKGTTVNIKVSESGSSSSDSSGETSESKSVSLPISYDLAENQVFYLTVTVSDDDGTRNIISNQQRTKDAGSETVTLTGHGTGTVTVIIDNNVVMKKNVDFNTGELS